MLSFAIKSLFLIGGVASAQLDWHYGVGAENSNCGDVRHLLDATIYAISSENQAEALERTSAYVDPINFVRFCSEGICRYEDNFAEMVQHIYIDSLVLEHWTYSELVSSYGAHWAKGSFYLDILNVCGDDSGKFMAEFTFYCNGEQGKITEADTLRDEVVFMPFLEKTTACFQSLNITLP